MFNVLSPRTSLIEVVIPITFNGTLQKVKFQNQETLMSVTGKDVFIKAIEVLSNDFMSSSPLTAGVPVASPADIQNATMTLSAENDIFMDQCPLPDLVRLRSNLGSTPFSNQLFLLDDVNDVDWTKCFITVILAPIALPISYLINVHYGYERRKFFM